MTHQIKAQRRYLYIFAGHFLLNLPNCIAESIAILWMNFAYFKNAFP